MDFKNYFDGENNNLFPFTEIEFLLNQIRALIVYMKMISLLFIVDVLKSE